MTVRAKFRVHGIRRSQMHVHGVVQEVHTVELSPVIGNANESEENQKFYALTPSGKIELGCVNAATVNFELGLEYYVDFTPAKQQS